MLKLIKIKAMSVIMCLIVLASALPTAVFAQTATGGISSEAEVHILNELRRARIPSAAVAIIQDGETSYILKDSTHYTLFQIGSVSKSFTGFGVLLLEDMGLLSIYDPVSRYLPWFEVSYNGLPIPHGDIRVYHLLQNASGFTSDERLFPRAAVTESTDDFIARIEGIELAFYPSARHVYGNMNYIILGFLIEAVSGQSYDEFMTEQVLRPLGLYNTFISAERAHETGWVIGGNRLRFLQAVPWNPPFHYTWVPSGRIYANITDLARWAGIHLGVVNVSEQFERVIQRSHENHGSVDFFAHSNYFYTAGWYVTYENDRIRHNGTSPGYSASVRILPNDNMAVVVLGNLVNGAVPFGELISDIIIESEPFNSVQMDLFTIIDIFYTISIAVFTIYIGFFIWFIARVIKRLNSGEIVNRKLTFKIRWLIVPLIFIADLVYSYVSPSMMGNTSHEFAVLHLPASLMPATIALWIALVCSLCAFFIKVFGLSANLESHNPITNRRK